MKHTWRLIKIQLLDISGINQARYGSGKKFRSRQLLTFLMLIFVGAVFAGYSLLFTKAYIQFHMGDIVLPLMYAAATIAVLFTSILKTGGLIFSAKDFDMLSALPIPSSSIILSRFTTLYLMNEAFCICILLPSGILYGLHISAGIFYYLLLILMILLTPVIPLIIATIIGTLLLCVSARFRHKNLVMIVLGFAALCALMIAFFRMPDMDVSAISSLNETLLGLIYGLFPLARIFYGALCKGTLWMAAVFILLNILLYTAFLKIMSCFYKSINTAVTAHSQKSNYKITMLDASSVSMALYKKELRRYFSSPIYVLNTALGPVLMILMAAVLLLSHGQIMLNLPGFDTMLPGVLPFVLGFCAIMNAPAASSISMEGSGFWQLLVLPVRPSQIFNSKRWITFTISVPCIFISGILILLKIPMSPVNALFLFLVPLAFTWLSSECGLYFNLKWPNFHWKTETAVVKQSAPVMICILGGMFLSMAPAFLIMAAGNPWTLWILCGSVLTTILLALLFRYLNSRIALNQLEG